MQRLGGVGVLDIERHIPSACAGTARPLKLQGGGRRESISGRVERWVEAVAGRSEEIGRGRGILTQKGGDRAWTLDTAWPLKLRGGGHR
jgi:hypothetical protein